MLAVSVACVLFFYRNTQGSTQRDLKTTEQSHQKVTKEGFALG